MNEYLYLPDSTPFNIGVKSSVIPDLIQISNSNHKEVVRIDKDGRIFWLGREVTTDDEFRQTMLELHKAFTTRYD
jgi:hypothetical protein